jgi:hypothetical protein
MQAQKSDSFYRKAGYLLVNDGDLSSLRKQTQEFYRYVRQIGG